MGFSTPLATYRSQDDVSLNKLPQIRNGLGPFWDTAADPPDSPEMEHELRLATHQQRAGGQDDVSLNKLPQIMKFNLI